MNNSIEINGEKFSSEDLLLLVGEDEIKEPEKVKSYILLVARALGKRQIQKQQVVGLAVDKALLQKTRLVIQVGPGLAQHRVEAATALSRRRLQRGVLRQVREVAKETPDEDARATAEPRGSVTIGVSQ